MSSVTQSINDMKHVPQEKAPVARDPNDEMGKDAFLLLFTEQLKHQDPLNPMDNAEFVQQLAQFSQLEASKNVQESVEKMAEAHEKSLGLQNMTASSMTNASAVSLVGKEVRLKDTDFMWNGSGTRPISVHMGARTEVEVAILDNEGEVVRMLTVGDKDQTNAGHTVWDGRDDSGNMVPPGDYYIHVVGQDSDPSLYAFVEDTVTGLRYTAEGPQLKIDGREITIANILEVNPSKEQGGGVDNGFGNLALNQAIPLIGSSIVIEDQATSYTARPGGSKTFSVDMAGNTDGFVHVKNSSGQTVQRIPIEGGGKQEVDVDFIDYDGSGDYHVVIEGAPGAFFYYEGTIDSVFVRDGQVRMRTGGQEINPNRIIEIST